MCVCEWRRFLARCCFQCLRVCEWVIVIEDRTNTETCVRIDTIRRRIVKFSRLEDTFYCSLWCCCLFVCLKMRVVGVSVCHQWAWVNVRLWEWFTLFCLLCSVILRLFEWVCVIQCVSVSSCDRKIIPSRRKLHTIVGFHCYLYFFNMFSSALFLSFLFSSIYSHLGTLNV